MNIRRRRWIPLAICLAVMATVALAAGSGPPRRGKTPRPPRRPAPGAGRHGPGDPLIAEGMQTFRYDTFGDEVFWGGALRLHEAVASLSPRQALGLGLKVDSDALPLRIRQELRRG